MKDNDTRNRQDLVEVWSDVVSKRQLAWCILICVGAAGIGYVGCSAFLGVYFSSLDQTVAKGYALSAGVLTCIVAAVMLGMKVKPKRVVDDGKPEDEQILDVIEGEGMTPQQELEALLSLPADVKSELREIGMYDAIVFAVTSKTEQRESNPPE